jgi:FtsH-binding integral membrane protein
MMSRNASHSPAGGSSAKNSRITAPSFHGVAIGATIGNSEKSPVSLENPSETSDIPVTPMQLRSAVRRRFAMANWRDPMTPSVNAAGVATATRGAEFDAGLRSYMLSVYNYMASGVLVTGIVAMLFAQSGFAAQILMGPGLMKYVIMFAPLAFVMVLSFGIGRLSTSTAQMLFWAFAAVMGLSLSSVFLMYTGTSIAQTFFATAAAFAGLSLFGYTTKKDLSAFGTFLIMGVVGLFVAMLINLFVQSSALDMAISFIGVLLFAGLTAYDTQRIKSMYAQVAGTEMMGKTVIMGALQLYLDFINMFLFLLRFMGGNRD